MLPHAPMSKELCGGGRSDSDAAADAAQVAAAGAKGAARMSAFVRDPTSPGVDAT